MIMQIYIGADHRGYKLKEKSVLWLSQWGYEYEDLGANNLDLGDDYTLFAKKVALKVRKLTLKGEDARGLLFCGSGVGMNVAANKFDGVRASIGKSVEQIRAGRNDDDMNILVRQDTEKDSKTLKKLKSITSLILYKAC